MSLILGKILSIFLIIGIALKEKLTATFIQ